MNSDINTATLSNPSSFISSDFQLSWHNTPIVADCCYFQRDLYQDQLCEQLGVKFNPSLNKAVVKRRAEFLAGRYCANKSLHRLGHRASDIAIGKNRAPEWPNSICGSITHSEGIAAAVCMTKGRIRAVGIDFEKRIADKTRTQITDQILHGSEHQVLANHTGDLNTIFTLIFSAKESFFKAAHDEVQRYFGFEALKLVSIDPQNQILHFEIQETLSASYVSGMAVQVYYQLIDDKSVATLCYF